MPSLDHSFPPGSQRAELDGRAVSNSYPPRGRNYVQVAVITAGDESLVVAEGPGGIKRCGA
jgi:hypothetical protein